jgi:hypothetical protein
MAAGAWIVEMVAVLQQSERRFASTGDTTVDDGVEDCAPDDCVRIG